MVQGEDVMVSVGKKSGCWLIPPILTHILTGGLCQQIIKSTLRLKINWWEREGGLGG